MNRTMAKTRSSIQAPKETVHVCAERPLQTSLLRYLICYGWFETDGAVALAQLSLTRLRQEDAFLEHGIDQVRPPGPRTVVDAIKVHQATVSRVTSNTYMQTPREVFELKYFFTVASASSQGGDARSPRSCPPSDQGDNRRRIAR